MAAPIRVGHGFGGNKQNGGGGGGTPQNLTVTPGPTQVVFGISGGTGAPLGAATATNYGLMSPDMLNKIEPGPTLRGAGPPADGVTTAYFPNQLYVDNTDPAEPIIWTATTASGAPPAPGGSTWTQVTAAIPSITTLGTQTGNFTVPDDIFHALIPVDSTGGPFTITGSASRGTVTIVDVADSLATNPVTFDPNGAAVNGGTGAVYAIADDGASIEFYWNDPAQNPTIGYTIHQASSLTSSATRHNIIDLINDLGSPGDGGGVTPIDETPLFEQAIAQLAPVGGGIIYARGIHYLNLTIEQDNITIVGVRMKGAGVYDPDGTSLRPFDGTQPVITWQGITAGPDSVTGGGLHNLTVTGRQIDQFGIRMNSTREMSWSQVAVVSFTDHCIEMTSEAGNRSTSHNHFHDLYCETSSPGGTGLRADYGASFTTGTFITGGRFTAAEVSNACCVHNGTEINYTDTYFDTKHLSGIKLNTVGPQTGKINANGVHLDIGDANDICLEIDTHNPITSHVCGTINISGNVRFDNGTPIDVPFQGKGIGTTNQSFHASPIIGGNMYLNEPGDPATAYNTDANARIARSGTSVLADAPNFWRFRVNNTDMMQLSTSAMLMKSPIQLETYTVATAPSPTSASFNRSFIHISDGGPPGIYYSDGARWKHIASAQAWTDIAANTTLSPGNYDLHSASGGFSIPLEQSVGEWEFANTSQSLGTNAVLIGSAAQTFTDLAGAQVPGPFIAGSDGMHFKIKNVAGTNNFEVILQPSVTINGALEPRGAWDASTNTPDITQAVNQGDGTNVYYYLITTAGTQDIGQGSTDYQVNGQITFFDQPGAGAVFRYDEPNSLPGTTHFPINAAQDLDALTVPNDVGFMLVNTSESSGQAISYASRTLNYSESGSGLFVDPASTGFTLRPGERAWISKTATDVNVSAFKAGGLVPLVVTTNPAPAAVGTHYFANYSGDSTFTLPDYTALADGDTVRVTVANVGQVQVVPNGGQAINGITDALIVLGDAGQTATFYYTGTDWAYDRGFRIEQITADPAGTAQTNTRYLADYTGTFTLPDYTNAAIGRVRVGDKIELVNIGSNGITITPQPGQSINGIADATLLADHQDGRWTIEYDGVDWSVTKGGSFVGTSSRLGEFFFAKSDSTVQGLLPVNPGTVTNGAVIYPKWAAMYPEFVSGNDIVFPPDVAGMFVRNLGGNAATEGTLQADATAPNGLRLRTNSGAGGNVFNATHSMFTNTGNTTSQGSVQLQGDTETRPANRAYQLYTVVDGYGDTFAAGTLVAESARVLLASGSDTNVSGTESLPLAGGRTLADLGADFDYIECSAIDGSWDNAATGVVVDAETLVSSQAVRISGHGSSGTRYFINGDFSSTADTTITISTDGGGNNYRRFRMYGVKKPFNAIRAEDTPVNVTEVGTPLNGSSTREYVLQWNGTEIVNTLAKESWSAGGDDFVVDHLTREMTVYGSASLTSGGTVSWSQAFADTTYTFAHDLREAQAETASLRINSRTTTSVTYTLYDSAGTGDNGSIVQYAITGKVT